MEKIKLLFNRRGTATASKRAAVEVECSIDNQRIRLSTGVLLYKNEWRANRVCNRPDAAKLNQVIAGFLERAQEAIDMPGATPQSVRSMIKGGGCTVLEWAEDFLLGQKITSPSTRLTIEWGLKQMRDSRCFTSWLDFDYNTICAFDEWLSGRGFKDSTIWNAHSFAKRVARHATFCGLLKRNPYDMWHLKRVNRLAERRYLTIEQRNMVRDVKLEWPSHIIARDLFMFACYTGLASIDIRQITDRSCVTIERGRLMLIARRHKSGVRYRITLLPEAVAILEHYNYNLNLQSPAVTYSALHYIAGKIGLPHLSIHMGRHTFATWALREGVRIEVVSKMLAHTNIQTTQIYAKILQQEVDEGFDLLASKK